MVWNEVLITLLVLAVPICMVNVIFIILIYQRASLDKLQNALLFSLGCSHFCAGFFAIPCVLLCSLIDFGHAKCNLCIASYLLNRFMMISSFLHLMAVVYERYLKVVHPFWFQNKELTLLQSRHIVPSLWCVSLLISAAPLTWWPLKTPCPEDERVRENLDRNIEYFDHACLALFCIALLLMIYAFVRMFVVVHTHLVDINTIAVQLRASMDNMLTQSIADSSNDFEPTLAGSNSQPYLDNPPQREFELSSCQILRKELLRKEAKIAIRFAAMVLMFILSWGTYFYLSRLERNSADDIPLILRKIVIVVMFLNPLIDPWILTVGNKDFRPCYNFFGNCMSHISRGAFACWSRLAVCLAARKQHSSGYTSSVRVRVEKSDCGGVTNV